MSLNLSLTSIYLKATFQTSTQTSNRNNTYILRSLIKSIIILDRCKTNLRITTAILFRLTVWKEESRTASKFLKLIKETR